MMRMPILFTTVIFAALLFALVSCAEGVSNAQHQAAIAERDAIITQQQAAIVENQSAIRRQQAVINGHLATINDQRAALAEQRDALSDRTATIQRHEDTISEQTSDISALSSQIHQQEGLPDSLDELEQFVVTLDDRDHAHAMTRGDLTDDYGKGSLSLYEYQVGRTRVNSADRVDNGLLDLALLKMGVLMADQDPNNAEVPEWSGPVTGLTLGAVESDGEAVLLGLGDLRSLKNQHAAEQSRLRRAFNRGDIPRADYRKLRDAEDEGYDSAEWERRWVWRLIGFSHGVSQP